jgi:hypothetical protein
MLDTGNGDADIAMMVEDMESWDWTLQDKYIHLCEHFDHYGESIS